MKLTDDQIWDIWNSQGSDEMNCQEASEFARAIEAEVLRGITGGGRGDAPLYANSAQVKEALAGELGSIDVWPLEGMKAPTWGKPGTGFYDTPIYLTPPQQEQAGAVMDGWIDAVQKLVNGFEHVSGIARQWEPDYSSGEDRAKWARATEACADVVRLLAAAPKQETGA